MAGKRLVIDRSDIIAFMALVVSLGAMVTAILQTHILKEQQQIMADQQEIMASQLEGSVWPFLKTSISLSQQDDMKVITYSLTNKGVGPAKIKQFELVIADTTITSFLAFIEVVGGLVGKERLRDINFSLPVEVVLAAGEVHQVFKLSYQANDETEQAILGAIGDTKLCYCSIYDACYGDCESKQVE